MLALSHADSALQSEKVRHLFLQICEISNLAGVKVSVNNFKKEWCNERLGCWIIQNYQNYVSNTGTKTRGRGVVFCVLCFRVVQHSIKGA